MNRFDMDSSDSSCISNIRSPANDDLSDWELYSPSGNNNLVNPEHSLVRTEKIQESCSTTQSAILNMLDLSEYNKQQFENNCESSLQPHYKSTATQCWEVQSTIATTTQFQNQYNFQGCEGSNSESTQRANAEGSILTSKSVIASSRNTSIKRKSSEKTENEDQTIENAPANFNNPVTSLKYIRSVMVLDEKYFRCPFCSSIFKLINTLRKHLHRKHNEFIYTCRRCFKMFSDTASYDTHIKTNECRKTNASIQQVKVAPNVQIEAQKLAKERKLSVAADNQDQSFDLSNTEIALTPKNMNNRPTSPKYIQSVMVLDEKFFLCPFCISRFKLKSTLRKHLIYKHNKFIYTCRRCFKMFSDLTFYDRHITTGECRQTNSSIQQVKVAANVQMEAQKSAKKRISSNAAGNQDHSFDLSNRETEHTPSNLSNRVTSPKYIRSIMVLDEKFFLCPFCINRFKLKNSFRKHLFRKHNKFIFTCKRCLKMFSDKAFYNRHVRTNKCSTTNVSTNQVTVAPNVQIEAQKATEERESSDTTEN